MITWIAPPRPSCRPPRRVRPGATRLITATALAVATTGLVCGGPPAIAAPPDTWATFDQLSGSSRDYETTLHQQPSGWPAASVHTTSVGGGAVGVQGGTGTFLAPTTPPGSVYGSSRGAAYLNLRPNGLAAAPPSVTGYVFEHPTPAAGWTFVLGDIDADEVQIDATGADDQPLVGAQLGFRGAFNYCAPGTSPKPTCGLPNNDGLDRPRWDATSRTLTGNTGAVDTAGASGWFEPTVPIRSLTFTYRQRSGSPVYQTWFAALAHDLTGTVSTPSGTGPVTVRLYRPDGALVGSTTTDVAGGYAFPGLATYAGYRVSVVRPDGLTSDQPLSRTVDLSERDGTADFTLRAVLPVPVGGRVTDHTTGGPLDGVPVRVTGPDGYDRTVTTGPDGRYLIDHVPVGTGYRIEVADLPAGYRGSTPAVRTFDVATGSETPVTGQDFALDADVTGTLGGTVTDADSGDPLDQVLVTVSDGTHRYEVRTDADGHWSRADLAPGPYSVTVTAPDGSTVNGASTRTATVPDTGGTVDGLDFSIRTPAPAATHALDGTVRDPDGRAVPGATVTVEPPGGGAPLTAAVDDAGRWRVPGLPDGQGYLVGVDPPDGFRAPSARTIDIRGADIDAITLVVTPLAGASPSASPSPAPSPTASSGEPAGSPTASASAAPATQQLADTGGPSLLLPLLGLVALIAGLGCLLVVRRSGRRS